jgi:hypothetical protein
MLQSTVVAKIHMRVELCPPSKYWLLLCVDVVSYTVEQCVFLYELYVDCGSATFCSECLRELCHS